MRKDFQDLIDSYIKISEELVENDIGITPVENELLVYLDKEELHSILTENNELSVSHQMKFWKEIGFIKTNKNEKRYASKVKIKSSWVRKYVINLEPYFVFKEIVESKNEGKKIFLSLYYEHEALTKYLLNKATEKIIERPGKIYLDNEYFKELLSKKPFLSVEEKLKYMKKLGLIITDKDQSRYTKKVLIGDSIVRKIVLNVEKIKGF